VLRPEIFADQREGQVMHSLDVVITKNAEAAGREAGHAHNDDSIALLNRIYSADIARDSDAEAKAWVRGYRRGRQEG